MGREPLAPGQARQQAFVERQEFFQPPWLPAEEVAALQIKAFQQEVAHPVEAGVVSQGVQGLQRQRRPVGQDGQFNQTLPHVPGTQPEGGHPDLQDCLAQHRVGQQAGERMPKAIREHVPAMRGDQPLPATDVRGRRAEGRGHLGLREPGLGLAQAVAAAYEQDQQPLLKTIARFPDQLERPAQGDFEMLLAAGRDADVGGVGRRRGPFASARREADATDRQRAERVSHQAQQAAQQ